MFFIYVFIFVFIVIGITFFRLATVSHERLREDGYSDRVINSVKDFFNTNTNKTK